MTQGPIPVSSNHPLEPLRTAEYETTGPSVMTADGLILIRNLPDARFVSELERDGAWSQDIFDLLPLLQRFGVPIDENSIHVLWRFPWTRKGRAHAILRKILVQFLAAIDMTEHAAFMRDVAWRLVEEHQDGDMLDVAAFAQQLAFESTCQMVGLTRADDHSFIWDRLREVWALRDLNVLKSEPPEVVPRMLAIIEQERSNPQAYLIQEIVKALDKGRVTEQEAAALLFGTFQASVGTTNTAISLELALLALHPPALDVAMINLDDSAIAGNNRQMIHDEVLRFGVPFGMEPLICLAKTKLPSGLSVPAGMQARYVFKAINQDPAFGPRPERFDVTRWTPPTRLPRHTSFGLVPHACVGDRMGLQMMDTAMVTVLSRLRPLEVAEWSREATLADPIHACLIRVGR